MSFLRKSLLPLALGLVLSPTTWADDDDKKSEAKKTEEHKVWGVVSEVTLVGEADVDNVTGQATIAEATIVTVLGHPAHHDGMHHGTPPASASQDKEAKKPEGDQSRMANRPRHRMNVYMLAIAPKTKVCEVEGMGNDAKETTCDLDKLEIGDRVEVTYDAAMMKADDKDGKDASKATKPATMKHGRHRTYFGTATGIKIMDEPSEGNRPEMKDKTAQK